MGFRFTPEEMFDEVVGDGEQQLDDFHESPTVCAAHPGRSSDKRIFSAAARFQSPVKPRQAWV